MKLQLIVEVTAACVEDERWRIGMILREIEHHIVDVEPAKLIGVTPIHAPDGVEIGAYRIYE